MSTQKKHKYFYSSYGVIFGHTLPWRGKLIGSADYRLHVEIRHNAAPVFQFIGTAEVLYAEGFKRGSATSFTDEAENKWNNPIDIGLDIDSSTGKACFRWGDPGDFDTIEWGAC